MHQCLAVWGEFSQFPSGHVRRRTLTRLTHRHPFVWNIIKLIIILFWANLNIHVGTAFEQQICGLHATMGSRKHQGRLGMLNCNKFNNNLIISKKDLNCLRIHISHMKEALHNGTFCLVVQLAQCAQHQCTKLCKWIR
jgi:hypothetical protein